MLITIPVCEQPVVGQTQEFTIKGLVKAVDFDSENPGQMVATIEVDDPGVSPEQRGMTNYHPDKVMRLRGEMRGG